MDDLFERPKKGWSRKPTQERERERELARAKERERPKKGWLRKPTQKSAREREREREREGERETEEGLVTEADTCADPRAMVVEPCDTPAAEPAMF